MKNKRIFLLFGFEHRRINELQLRTWLSPIRSFPELSCSSGWFLQNFATLSNMSRLLLFVLFFYTYGPLDPGQFMIRGETILAKKPKQRLVQGGVFCMGSDQGHVDEQPVHHVCIQSYYISAYEVTYEEYDRFARATGRSLPDSMGLPRGRHPVVKVNWYDAKAYGEWLSRQTGINYRLPTEIEWEYSARSGSDEKYGFGNNDRLLCQYANVMDQLFSETLYSSMAAPCRDGYFSSAPVGSYLPNHFGLYDMLGNVREWVEDCYNAYKSFTPIDVATDRETACRYRVVRGGDWGTSIDSARVSAREIMKADWNESELTGFRLARDAFD